MALLEELLAAAEIQRAREMIRSAGHPDAMLVETFLDLSARHVSVVRLGATLYRTTGQPPSTGPLSVSSATLDTAAKTLVFANGRTSIDHCATALLRWHHLPPPRPDREHDFAELQGMAKRNKVSLSPHERQWFDAVLSSSDAKTLSEFRDATTHRALRQDVAITIGSSPSHSVKLSSSTSKPESHEAESLLDRIAALVERLWHQFWSGLGR